jgi:nicotinate-nucleotide pyrophosphorylase (carboxylating)
MVMAAVIQNSLEDLLPAAILEALVVSAIDEDRGSGDLTSESAVPVEARGRARLVARQAGVLSGLPAFAQTFAHCDPSSTFRAFKGDGQVIAPEEVVAEVEGNARGLLLAERTALNFVQRMSGIATATAKLVSLADGRVRILDTRKTTPGLRSLEKYAVLCGGGENHRFGLFDEVMIKENHIDLAGTDVQSLTRLVRESVGESIRMTVEARDAEEAFGALRGGANVLLLDNMTPTQLQQLTPRLRDLARELGSHAELEASGGIDASNLAEYSHCGLDRISVGALTHSAPSLDLSLYLEPST